MRAIALMVLLAGCAELPLCSRFTMYAVATERGTAYLMDDANAAKLNAVLKGLKDGTCRAN